jgi:uncharacterized membrane protein YjgN (DUF898 family)
MYFSMQYRASRTSWRGIYFRLDGNGLKYFQLLILSILSRILTFNFLTPYTDIKRKSYFWNNLYFGKNKFNIKASSSPLMKINIITTLLAIPTLFISRIWYYAALDRHIYANLTINTVKMSSTVSGDRLALLWLVNILLFIFTLGIATPYIVTRNIQFYVDNHFIVGALDKLDYKYFEQNSIKMDYGFYFFGSFLGSMLNL